MDSHIAYGAPHKQDTSAAHGEPLGEEEIRLTKRNYGWPEDAKFLVPDGVYDRFQEQLGQRGHSARDAWMAKFAEYSKQFPELGEPSGENPEARAAGGLGRRHSHFPGGSQGPGGARRVGQSAERHRASACRG